MYQFTKPFVLCTTATCTIVTGIICSFLFPSIIESKVRKGVVLEDGSDSLKRWLSPPTLDFKVYLFNVTNPVEVHYGGNPIVEEIGPYVYTEYHNKEVITYHDDDTVSYNTRKKFFFNKKKSDPHKETDLITLINPALMGIVLMVEEMLPFALPYVNDSIPYLFNQTTIFTTATVEDILFNGIRINCTHVEGFGKMACSALKGRALATMRQEQNSSDYLFSFLHHKNDSTIGPFRVSRGRNNAKELGQIKMFEEKEELDVWPVNSTCNNIRGTDSTIFPPFIEKTEPIYIYVPEMCGSLFAEFESESSVDSIDVLNYVGSQNNFADPFKYTPNKCYCNGVDQFQSLESVEEKSLVCPKQGVMFLQKCHKAPIVFSKPHFYSADSQYTDYIKGLKPNRMEHETFVQIEPMSGTPVEGHKRLQMNMYLRNVSEILILKHVKSGLMPLLWIEEDFELGDEYKSLLVTFYHLLTALKVFPWFLIFGGIVTFGFSIYLTSENLAICGVRFFSRKINSVQHHVAENGAYSIDNVRTFPQESTAVNADPSLTFDKLRKMNHTTSVIS